MATAFRYLDRRDCVIYRIWAHPSTGLDYPVPDGGGSIAGFEQSVGTTHPYPYVAVGNWTLNRVKIDPVTFSGTRETSLWHHRGENMPSTVNVLAPGIGFNLSNQVSEAAIKAQGFGSAPLVNLPLAIAELKDFPGMLRSIRDIFRRVATAPDAYLNWQFGIKPLWNDLKALYNLQQSMADQFKRVAKVAKEGKIGGSLGETCYPVFGYYGKRYTGTVGLSSLGSARCQENFTSSECRSWYSANVEPYGWSMEDRSDLTSTSSQLGFRWSNVAPTLYNLIPFSFMADYFVNLGDLVQSTDNRFPWVVSNLCIMNHMVVKTTVSILSMPDYLSGSPGSNTIERKRRNVALPIKGLRFTPMISNTQALNIVAIMESMKQNRAAFNKRYPK